MEPDLCHGNKSQFCQICRRQSFMKYEVDFPSINKTMLDY